MILHAMSITLYDYQEAALREVRQAYRDGYKAPLLVSPTGSGKTVMFSSICEGIQRKGNTAWILVHRQELVDQVCDTLHSFGVRHGVIAPAYPFASSAPIQVASVFTLVRRLAQKTAPNLIIIDEAHHAILRSTWGKVIGAFPASRLLGVTATPTRLSGEGLGDIFDKLIVGPSVQTLIDMGRLSPVRVFAPPTVDLSEVHTRMGDYVKSEISTAIDKPKITGDVVAHYQKITPNARAAVFCVSLEHAAHVADQARAAGISAVTVDGNTDRQIRREIIKDFQNGSIKWLVTVDLISEGFDCPGIDVGISLRPTQSVGLWLQQCGRVLRTAPGKSHATILDHAGNTLRHGLPTEDRDWSLSGSVVRNSGGAQSQRPRVCPKCFSATRGRSSACPHCGEPYPVESPTIAKAKGELKEVTQEEIDRHRERQAQGQAKNVEALIELARRKGYKSPERWAQYVMEGRAKKKAARGG
jgi:superfamily II DNA or RNA helicase